MPIEPVKQPGISAGILPILFPPFCALRVFNHQHQRGGIWQICQDVQQFFAFAGVELCQYLARLRNKHKTALRQERHGQTVCAQAFQVQRFALQQGGVHIRHLRIAQAGLDFRQQNLNAREVVAAQKSKPCQLSHPPYAACLC